MKTKTQKSETKEQAPAANETQKAVFFTGPYTDMPGNDGISRPYWRVSVATALDAEAKYSYRIWNFEKAASLAEKISKDQMIELVNQAKSAN